MSSDILQPFLGALQASVSVLLTVGYGVLAAQFDLLSSNGAKEVSRTCVRLLLPALLFTKVGAQLHIETAARYGYLLIWAIVYNGLSITLGFVATRTFSLPTWVTPALSFNNTTSLPLLLLQSLADTGILDSILMSDSDTASAAVNRANSYFLINSMVSNSLTFALGPKLLRPHEEDSPDDAEDKKGAEDDDGADGDASARDEEEGGGDSGSSNGQGAQNRTHEDAMQEFIHEETSLLPNAVVKKSNQAEHEVDVEGKHIWHKIPKWGQSILLMLYAFLNAPFIGAVAGAIVGLVPALHTLFFSKPTNGGYLEVWLTSSIKNLGDLFAALQIVVVGVKLSQSMLKMKRGEDSGNVPWKTVVFVTSIRFIFWPLISIPVMWALVSKAGLLGSDPILWFCMMLMPVGPPAMILTALADVEGSSESDKMAIAKFLTIQYALTPLICFGVVGSLKATSAALNK